MSPWALLTIWFIGSILLIWIVKFISGFQGSFFQFLENDEFSFINVLGLIAVLLSALTAIVLSIPGRNVIYRKLPYFTFTVWLLIVGISLQSEFVSFSGAAWWGHMGSLCFNGSLVFGIIPAAFLFLIVKRNAPTKLLATGILCALAGASLGALAIECSCSSGNPYHILVAHFLPVGIVLLAGMLLSKKLLRW